MKHAIRILHLFDSTIGWDQRLALEQLLERLAPEHFEQHLASLGPPQGESARLGAPHKIIPRRYRQDLLTGPVLRRFIEQCNIDLVHAWGAHAASAAMVSAPAGAPIVASIFDPARTEIHARLFRVRRGELRLALVCATEIVRRRCVERGASREVAVLVRPGLDFATLNRARKSDLRGRLGLGPQSVALLTDPPPTRDGGHFCAFWATAVRSFLEPAVRLVVPGCSREASRLRRLGHELNRSDILILPGERYRFEALIAVADVLLMPGASEGSVTAVAWAMGAGVPVIASATRATAELLAHDHNAFLIKPDDTKRLAMRFAAALGRRHDWRKQTEVARGQAYEVFSLRRAVDQVRQVYDNLCAGRTPAHGIEDPAIIGSERAGPAP